MAADHITSADHLKRLDQLRDEVELLRRHLELARPLSGKELPPAAKREGNPGK